MTLNTNAKTVRSLVTGAVAEFQRYQQTDRAALLACATATWSAFDSGLIGKDQSANGGWDSQKDYAALYVSSRTNQPVTHTTVIMWKRLGRAMSLGITPGATRKVRGEDVADTPVRITFDRIVQCFGDARVSDALENGSKAAIVKAVAAIFTPDGKKVPAKKADTEKDKAAKPASETDADAVPVTRNNSTVITTMETLAARLSETLSPAESKRLAAFVESLAERLAISAAATSKSTSKAA